MIETLMTQTIENLLREVKEIEGLLFDYMETLSEDDDDFYTVDGLLQDINWISDYEGQELIDELESILDQASEIL